MQGKVTLEDHFAIEATLGDSQPFGTHVWTELRHRLLDFQDQRLRLMDETGVEIMIASLNAPAIQAIPDPKRAARARREATTCWRARSRSVPTASSASPPCPCRTPRPRRASWNAASTILVSKGRWSTAISEVAGSSRPIHYDLPQYRPFWHALEKLDVPFYLHPRPPMAEVMPHYEGHHWLFGPTWSFAAETSLHASAADRQWSVRRMSAPADHSRTTSGRAAVLHLAYRQPEQLDEGPAQVRGTQARVADYFRVQFPHHHLGTLQHARADRRDRGDRCRPGNVLGRLSVRGLQRRRRLVRQGRDRGHRSTQDRTHQCDEAVQARGSVTPVISLVASGGRSPATCRVRMSRTARLSGVGTPTRGAEIDHAAASQRTSSGLPAAGHGASRSSSPAANRRKNVENTLLG